MNLRTITEPTSCPTCNSTLELVNDQLFCRNNNCEAKTSKLIEHFAKTLKIKGLGPKTIDKLPLNSISDIYSISKKYEVSIPELLEWNKKEKEVLDIDEELRILKK